MPWARGVGALLDESDQCRRGLRVAAIGRGYVDIRGSCLGLVVRVADVALVFLQERRRVFSVNCANTEGHGDDDTKCELHRSLPRLLTRTPQSNELSTQSLAYMCRETIDVR